MPDPETGHSRVCTNDKKVPKCPCCSLQLGPTHPKDFSLVGSGVSCSAVGTVLVGGNFLPSSRAWPTMEEPFPFHASGQGSHWAGSSQEEMLKPFFKVTDDPKLGAWREASRPGGSSWVVQCVGEWGRKEGWSQRGCVAFLGGIPR